MTQAEQMLAAARRLAALGLSVHWLRGPERGGKAPLSKNWQRAPYAPPHRVDEGWRPGSNLGVHTGLVEGAPVSVIAVDLDSAEALTWAREHLPATPWATITRKGEHWYYLHPGPGHVLPNKAKVGKIALDIRGDGGNVVCAPSTHPEGHVYAEREPWQKGAELPTFDPAWFPAPPAPPPPPTRRAARAPEHDQVRRRAERWLSSLPPAVSGQGRGFGLPESEALDLLRADYNPRCVPPWSERELAHKVQQAARAHSVPEGYLRDADRPGYTPLARLPSWRRGAPLGEPPPMDDVPIEVREAEQPAPREGRAEGAGGGAAPREGRRKGRGKKERPPRAPGPFHFALGSESEIATALLEVLGRDRELVHDRGDFYEYHPDRGIWCAISDDAVLTAVRQFDGAEIHDEDDEEKVIRLSNAKARGAIKFAVAELRERTPRFFDEAPPGVALADYFLAVTAQGVDFRPLAPENRQTFALPFRYDPEARAERWDRFLVEVFEGDPDAEQKRAFLQEFIGACLFGLAVRYEICVFLPGGGGNGKSQFVKVVTALFPPAAVTGVTPQRFSDLRHRAMLAGRRLNAVTEVPEHDLMDTEGLKALVSGDELMAEPKYRDPFKFKPTAGHLFAANKLPTTADATRGFWRKVEVIAFNRQFDDSPRRQLGLAEQIIEAELQGVLTWAVTGAHRLVQQGRYTAVPSSADVKAKWKRESNSVELFGEEALERCSFDDARSRSSELYDLYKAWTRRFGYRTVSLVKFSQTLVGLSYERKEDKAGTWFAVSIKTDSPQLKGV